MIFWPRCQCEMKQPTWTNQEDSRLPARNKVGLRIAEVPISKVPDWTKQKGASSCFGQLPDLTYPNTLPSTAELVLYNHLQGSVLHCL